VVEIDIRIGNGFVVEIEIRIGNGLWWRLRSGISIGEGM
jgi:hypothetical protein